MRLDLSKLNIDWPDVSPAVRYDQVGVYPKNRQGRLRLKELGVGTDRVRKAKAWTLEPIWDLLGQLDEELKDELWFAEIGLAMVDSKMKRLDWHVIGPTWSVSVNPGFMPNGYAVEVWVLKLGPESALLILSSLSEAR